MSEDLLILQKPYFNNLNLIDYFSSFVLLVSNNWNVEEIMPFFGIGRSNEGTDEGKYITRYYIKPYDQKFSEIYLNFDDTRTLKSILWMFNNADNEHLTFGEVKTLFGKYTMQNIIYDSSTEFKFSSFQNKAVKYIEVTVPEWVEIDNEGNLLYENENNIRMVDDNYKFFGLLIAIQ